MSFEDSHHSLSEVDVLVEAKEIESSEEPPWEEWSSLLCFLEGPDTTTQKRLFYAEGLYEPPSETLCIKYIPLSDSSVFRHPYYKYPAIIDPGIEDALLVSPRAIEYTDDGQELYLAECKEMNEAPCNIFYKQLLEPTLNVSFYGISSKGFRPMALALKNNRIVKSANFSGNFISQDGCFHFGKMLMENTTLTELNLSGCRMRASGVKALVAHLRQNKTLKSLNIAKNELRDEGVQPLADVISKGSLITNINLSYNSLTAISAGLLADGIEFHNILTKLDLSWNSISVPKYLELLVTNLTSNRNFTEIDLSWKSLNNRFTRALVNLIHIPNLRIIKLSNNKICNETILAMAAALRIKRNNVNYLDLSFNPLSQADAIAILSCLALKRVKIQKLLMDNVTVNNRFMLLLSRILSKKFRQNAVITHGYVSPTIAAKQPDLRELVLTRAQVVCSKPKKKAVDVGLMILKLNKIANGEPIPVKDLYRSFKEYGAFQINEDLTHSIALAFPAPRRAKGDMCNIAAMAEYVHRKWPDVVLPPTPVPTIVPPAPLDKKALENRRLEKAKAAKKGKK